MFYFGSPKQMQSDFLGIQNNDSQIYKVLWKHEETFLPNFLILRAIIFHENSKQRSDINQFKNDVMEP